MQHGVVIPYRRFGKKIIGPIFRGQDMLEERNHTYVGLHAECPIFCPILTEFGFYRLVYIIVPTISNFVEIRPMEAALIHAGRSDEANRRLS